MDMTVTMPGGLRVDAAYKGFTVKTDQPEKSGGENSAPSPFDLFLCSIGTCAGYYVMSFCRERNIPTDDIRVVMSTKRNEETHMVTEINIDIQLPKDFPQKYKKAVIASADKCSVKKHLFDPPVINITSRIG